ncbi:MAG TPA: bifunctional DNA-formamidopyrimidine glycosylase/DNA-(apurinic or apyrimidinic site) lyase [Acidimicrobiales bacterium]|nr:bifunctional DNA-formamidopyrimidine glycosylase/DNA-(apurinic or apyrimidinic site) lyase [Acidimicrobiales bacterium]
MPELPEAETVRRGVAAAFTGRRIAAVDATGVRSTRRHPTPAHFAERVAGRTLTGVRRVGKFIVAGLDDGGAFVVHLGMSGQLVRATAPDVPRPAHTHVAWRFDDAAAGEELRFVDPRTFGQVWATTGDVPELAHLGPDALDGLATWRDLARLVEGRTTRLKALLTDQRRLAGIGNIYADESLFAAGLAADRPAGSLRPAEVRRLHGAITDILAAAVQARGSSLADQQYRDLDGMTGTFQHRHAVYGREGKPCVRCGCPIVRAVVGGRSGFSCPRCQR